MKANAALYQWTSGELSPRLNGRTDIKKHQSGARTIENGIVTPHGGVRKRPGTQFAAFQRSNTDDVRFIPFQYSTEQAYVLVFGPNYVWFVKNRGLITFDAKTITGITQANPAVVTAAAHGFSNGDVVFLAGVVGMTEVNSRHFVVANAATNTFELTGCNSTGYAAYASGGTAAEIVTLATDYGADDLAEMQFAQANDVLYITHPRYPLTRINRFSHTSWTMDQPDITSGPFRQINPDRDNFLSIAPSWVTVTGVTRANPAVVTAAGHTFVEDDRIVFSGFDASGGAPWNDMNGTTFTVSNVTATTFEINANTSAYTASFSPSGDEKATYGETAYGTLPVGARMTVTSVSDVFDADMVGGLFRLNEEGGATGVSSAPVGDGTKSQTTGDSYTFEGHVYGVGTRGSTNGSPPAGWASFTRVPDHKAGTVRVQSGVYYFDADYLHPGYGVIRIVSVTSATEAVAEVARFHLPQSVIESGTSFWEEGAWSDYRGFPRALTFFEQRLWLGGTLSEPTVIWGSRSAAWEDFEDGDEDDDAIIYRLASGSADVIRWMKGGRILTCGTSMGEYAVSASSQQEALTPTNFRASVQTTHGTSLAFPVQVNQSVLYPQRAGSAANDALKLREFAYSFQSDAYGSADITIFAHHVTGDGFDEITYALDPDSLIMVRRTDGVMAWCTYEREQEVIAWHRHFIAGEDAEVRALLVSPGSGGDELWLSVKRTIGATEVRSIEFIDLATNEDTAKADGVYLDMAHVYEGASTATISGLNALAGESVMVLSSGNVEGPYTVPSNGRLTLARATTKAIVGKPYTFVLETQSIEAGAKAGTAQTRAQKISRMFLRLLSSLGGTYGTKASNQKPIHYRMAADPMDASPPLFSGLQDLDMPSGWERDDVIRIEHADPLPFFVTGMVAEINTSG